MNKAILSIVLDDRFRNLMIEQNILAICRDIRFHGGRVRSDVMKRERIAFMRVSHANNN